MAIARYNHPIWTNLAATSLVTDGCAMWVGADRQMLSMLYGAASAWRAIARGHAADCIFGAERYHRSMGRYGRPSLIAQAAARRSRGAFGDERRDGAWAPCGADGANLLMVMPFLLSSSAVAGALTVNRSSAAPIDRLFPVSEKEFVLSLVRQKGRATLTLIALSGH